MTRGHRRHTTYPVFQQYLVIHSYMKHTNTRSQWFAFDRIHPPRASELYYIVIDQDGWIDLKKETKRGVMKYFQILEQILLLSQQKLNKFYAISTRKSFERAEINSYPKRAELRFLSHFDERDLY